MSEESKRPTESVDSGTRVVHSAAVTWEHRLFDLFEDLEQQAEGLSRAERDAEVAELAVSGYSEVGLVDRVHASVGAELELSLPGAEPVRGVLTRVGADWCLVRTAGAAGEWLVRLSAVTAFRGLSPRAVPEPSRRMTSRLGWGSVLRSLAEDRRPVVVRGVDGQPRQGIVRRVGADFFELAGEAGVWVVPFAGVAALRG